MEGYPSRAAYKLFEINNRFRILKKGFTVVDLGASPGGWSQVAYELCKGGIVIAVDLKPVDIPGVEYIQGDITKDIDFGDIEGETDVVLSDASPNLSGHWSYDHARSIELASAAGDIARRLLRPGGNFVVKVFQGDFFKEYMDGLKGDFSFVKGHSPKASRKPSAEMYVVCKDLINAPVTVGEVLDVVVIGTGNYGDGYAEVEGFPIYIKGTEQGDMARVKITKIKKGNAFAELSD